MNSPRVTDMDRKIYEIEMQQFELSKYNKEKSTRDLIRQLNVLYEEFKKLPRFTNEQFEAAEANYFSQSLQRQANGILGAIESLVNMEQDLPAIQGYQDAVLKLGSSLDSETMAKLRMDLPNQMVNVSIKNQLENQGVQNGLLNVK